MGSKAMVIRYVSALTFLIYFFFKWDTYTNG